MSVPVEELAAHRRGIQSLIPILSAMRSIAEIAWRRAEERGGPLAEYRRALDDTLARLLANSDVAAVRRFASQVQDGRPVGLLLISSERGLCGAFNDRLVDYGLVRARELRIASQHVQLMCLGSRGQHLLETRHQTLAYARELPSLTVPSYVEIEQIALDLLDLEEKGGFGRLEVIRNSPVRRFQYAPGIVPLLPPRLPPPARPSPWKLVRPPGDVTALLTQLLTEHLLIGLAQAIVESAISEQLARVYAMRLATDNAQKMLDELTLAYNAATKQAITNSLLEIIAGNAATVE